MVVCLSSLCVGSGSRVCPVRGSKICERKFSMRNSSQHAPRFPARNQYQYHGRSRKASSGEPVRPCVARNGTGCCSHARNGLLATSGAHAYTGRSATTTRHQGGYLLATTADALPASTGNDVGNGRIQNVLLVPLRRLRDRRALLLDGRNGRSGCVCLWRRQHQESGACAASRRKASAGYRARDAESGVARPHQRPIDHTLGRRACCTAPGLPADTSGSCRGRRCHQARGEPLRVPAHRRSGLAAASVRARSADAEHAGAGL